MIVGLFTFVLVAVSFLLAIVILIQQGRGDMGLGGGQQMLFGGSGGQTMFEKITWALGIAFIFGALGLTIFKTKRVNESTLAGYRASSATMKADKKAAARHEANAPQEHKSESTK